MVDGLRIAVLGAGKVGANLGVRLAAMGHAVTYGARNTSSEKVVDAVARTSGASAVSAAAAAAAADVVVLAVPFAAISEVVTSAGDLDGKIVIDTVNAVGMRLPPERPTVAAHVAALAPGARVVKAFNTVGAEHYLDPVIEGRRVALPIAGDDEEARVVVAGLADAMGFDVIDLGGSDAAALCESFAALWIRMAFQRGYGRRFAFAVVGGPGPAGT